jgi:hypothetical protein
MVGLLAYPILLEPNLTLSQQNHFWFAGYRVSGINRSVLVALLALVNRRRVVVPISGATESQANEAEDKLSEREITFKRRLRWLVWSLVPSSLLCGVTTYITTDVVSAPLFWVIPLAAYLLSFIIAFGGTKWATNAFMVRRQGFLLLAATLTVAVGATTPVFAILPLHLLAFFATALICHGRLADRPAATHLTNFYLWISLGGVLGGLFNALLAPHLFDTVFEYPLMMVAAAFARPFVTDNAGTGVSKKLDWLLPLLLCVAMMIIVELGKSVPTLSRSNLHLMIFGITGVICLSFGYRPIRFGMGIIALLVIGEIFPPPYGQELFRDRSFFGAYRATYDVGSKRHILFHGTTVHGAQNYEPSARLQPLSYYHRTSPVGQVLLASARSGAATKVAIVGLGTGALACHGAPSQHFTFYEIDSMVERIARDERLFTYLRDCPPKVDVVIGDARLSLAKAPNRYYDIFVLDAFSSDVIPVHLLTRQALELYLRKTSDNGMLLSTSRIAHGSRASFGSLARIGLNAFIKTICVTEESSAEGRASRWILLARPRVVDGLRAALALLTDGLAASARMRFCVLKVLQALDR